MAVKIGHASIDENGKISGGTAGDQTGKEVCIRTWYSKPWSFVLRCKDTIKAEKMAIACEQGCANNQIGYNQYKRNTLYTQAKIVNYDLSKITTACECDCSSFMTVCALAAGIKITYGTNAPTTSTMKTVFSATGEFDILTDSKYLSNDTYLKRGDILVKAGSHTAMVLENGANTAISQLSATAKCIDVSSYQGNINWQRVKKSGIDYTILRGVIKNGSLDSAFEKNYSNAVQNGVKILGVYQFSYALSEETAKKDAINMINRINGKKLDIWLDLEWAEQRKLGKDKVTSIAKSYINTCKSLGYTCHVYSNLDWYKNVYHASELKNLGCKFWIARYPLQDNGTIKETLKPNIGEYMWQYSSKGSVDGISGNVDMNIIYGSIETSTTPLPSINISTETSIEFLGKVNTNSGNLNIRSAPNSSSTKVGSYAKGKLVQLIAKTSNNWYRTDKGYISSDYVIAARGKVFNCSKLNMRKEPKVVTGNEISILSVNDEVELLQEVNGWYKVKTKDKLVGYVSGKYITIL